MARPREFDNDKVLNALRDVFWRNGYEGTSYSDIMKATGLQKGSLYAAFGDKRALYQQALARYDAQEVRAAVEMLRDPNIPARQRIANLLQAPVESAGTKQGRWGCLLCNAAIDQAPVDADTESAVTAGMQRMQSAIEMALKDIPEFSEDEDKRIAKASALLTGYFGLRVLVKAGLTRTDIARSAADLLSF